MIKIEDFHIGFEYEELVHDDNRYFNQGLVWKKKVYGFNSPRLHKIDRLIKLGLIREA